MSLHNIRIFNITFTLFGGFFNCFIEITQIPMDNLNSAISLLIALSTVSQSPIILRRLNPCDCEPSDLLWGHSLLYLIVMFLPSCPTVPYNVLGTELTYSPIVL